MDSVWDATGRMIWENGIETCEMNRQSRLDAWYRVLRAGALDDPEGWDEEAAGKGIQDGEHMYTSSGFISMYGKTSTIL